MSISTKEADATLIGSHRGPILASVLVSMLVAVAIWVAIFVWWPPIPDGADPIKALVYAVRCAAVSVLLCLVVGVEGVAHERLFSTGFDPLSGYSSRFMAINLRYLQNTLEQTVVFAVGLVALASYCHGPGELRAVLAASIVWVASRWAFWIGYHVGPHYRGFGLAGMMQSLLVLLYVSTRFGFDTGGWAGASVPVSLFSIIEIWLVVAAWRAAHPS